MTTSDETSLGENWDEIKAPPAPPPPIESVIPMKFEFIELDRLDAFIEDPAWVMEQKLDGARCMVRIKPDTGITFHSHGGGKLAHSASAQHFPALREALQPVLTQVTDTGGGIVLDAELIGGTGVLWVFDLPYAATEDSMIVSPSDEFAVRRVVLETLFEKAGAACGPRIRMVPQARTVLDKARLAMKVDENGGEGVMLKRLDSTYDPGRRVKHTLKAKFVKDADVVIMERDRGAKNAVLGCYDAAGNLVEVGCCSMIGKHDAQPGDVAVVRYLYWTGASLYQPRFMTPRSDKTAAECTTAQFVPVSREVFE